MGALLASVCGLALWSLSFTQNWTNASYDWLFRFGYHPVTNDVVVILMDNDSYDHLNQDRNQHWDRGIHARLLNKLADDDCRLVVFDIYWLVPDRTNSDQALAKALRRVPHVVIGGKLEKPKNSQSEVMQNVSPYDLFLTAANTNWGIGRLDPHLDGVVRRHWPFQTPDTVPSLPWVAATVSGAQLDQTPSEKWLRYYSPDQSYTKLSYHLAFTKAPGYFRGKTVFIGSDPKNLVPTETADDKFSTPLTARTGEAVGGVEVLATSYINLVQGDWLRRPSPFTEFFLFLFSGSLFGASLCFFRRHWTLLISAASSLMVLIVAVTVSYKVNLWFPWLVLAGGQIPAALVWAWFTAPAYNLAPASAPTSFPAEPTAVMPPKTMVLSFPEDAAPPIPNYRLIEPAIGKGGFGKVWLAKNAVDQWQAIKVIYRDKFDHPKPYEAEFSGLRRYKPVSEEHNGLLRIELVSEQTAAGYFYYVMELGDSRNPGWEELPELYKPIDLEFMRRQGALPISECLLICIPLAETLAFLHQRNLTHRDIKPSNVVFVKGRPKLADIGLVSEARTADQVNTFVGTFGYLPPPPEPPGTVQADIYAFGKMLYVISTGKEPDDFPSVATTLMERDVDPNFVPFNRIILKACDPDLKRRYAATDDLVADLRSAAANLK